MSLSKIGMTEDDIQRLIDVLNAKEIAIIEAANEAYEQTRIIMELQAENRRLKKENRVLRTQLAKSALNWSNVTYLINKGLDDGQ